MRIKFLLIVTLGFVITSESTSQTLENPRITLKQDLTESYLKQNYFQSFKIAQDLSKHYQDNGNKLQSFNYTLKSSIYLSEFDPSKAQSLQKILLDSIWNNYKTLGDYWELALNSLETTALRNESLCMDSINFLSFSEFEPGDKVAISKYFNTIGYIALKKEAYEQSAYYNLQSFIRDTTSFKVIQDLGKALFFQQEYGPSLDAFLFALSLSDNPRERAYLTNRIGNCFNKIGQHEQAMQFYKYSLKLRLEGAIQDPSSMPTIYQNLGNCCLSLNQPDSALKYYNSSYNACLLKDSTNYEMLGNICNNVAAFYQKYGSLESSICYYEIGLHYRKKIQNDSKYIYQLISLLNLADANMDLTNLTEAKNLISEAEKIHQIIKDQKLQFHGVHSGLESKWDYYLFYKTQKKFYKENYNKTNSSESLKKYIKYNTLTIEELKKNLEAISDEPSKLKYTSELKELLLDQIHIQYLIDSLESSTNPSSIYEYFDYCHNSQLFYISKVKQLRKQIVSSQLLDFVTIKLLNLSSKDSCWTNQPVNWENLEDQINTEFSKSKFQNTVQLVLSQGMSFSYQSEYKELEALEDDEVLIEFIVDPEYNSIQYFKSNRGTSTYGTIPELDRIKRASTELNINLSHYNYKKTLSVLQELSQVFNNILESNNLDVNKLIIVPDEFLWDIPYDALLVNSQQKEKYLIELKDIQYHFSGKLFFDRRKQNITNREWKSWYGFAPNLNGYTRSNLDGTKDELILIADLIKESIPNISLFFEKSALLNNIPKNNFNNIIHIAGHSYQNNRINQTGFPIFSKANTKTIMFYEDIVNSAISGDLFYLNICDSNRYQILKGEGLLNINRALFLNGVNHIIYTNYKIEDNFAKEFALSFYNHFIQTNSISQSIANAKIQMIKSQNYSNPCWWTTIQVISSQ